jgi:hypothetical protein
VDLRNKDKAVDKLKKDLGVERKAVSERPEAVFSEGVVGGRFGVDSIQATADMILSKDARQIFEQSWEVAGTVGKKGEDGLTLAQRDLKKVMAQGISSLLLTPTDEVKKKVGEVSFAMLGKIMRSPAFDKAFPAGDPTRVAVERLAAKAAAVESSQKAGKLTAESITDVLKQSRDLVDGVIRYAKGPLSKEGRQASMLARAFFKLVGGQDQVNKTTSVCNRRANERNRCSTYSVKVFFIPKLVIIRGHFNVAFFILVPDDQSLYAIASG